MDFADSEARRVFFAYALPCLEVHVSRGALDKKQARNIIKSYSSDADLPPRMEEYFVRAIERCSKTAEKMGRSVIDAEAVRRCFRLEHDGYLKKESEEGVVRNPDYCRVWPGRVTELRETDHAVVNTPKGSRQYRTELVKDLKIGDLVAVHRDFIVEKIDVRVVDEMYEFKQSSGVIG